MRHCLLDLESGIGFCGDWCLDARAEAAWLSGRALGSALAEARGGIGSGKMRAVDEDLPSRISGPGRPCLCCCCGLRGECAGQDGVREHGEASPGAAGRSRDGPTTSCRRTATRIDEYYWLRDDTRAEPGRARLPRGRERLQGGDDARTRRRSRTRVYDEIVGRIKQDDSTVPYRKRGYWYYTRFETGKEYPIYARKAGTLDAPEQVMLDAQRAGRGPRFLPGRRDCESRPDNRLLAYAEDTVGRRQYTLRFKDLATGEDAAGPRSRTWSRPSPGPPTAAASSTSRRIRRRCSACRVRTPRARHRSGAGRARLRAGRRQLLHRRRDDQGRAVPAASSRRARSRPRWRYARRRRPGARLQGVPAARARPRVRRRAPRRPLDHPHQLAGARTSA